MSGCIGISKADIQKQIQGSSLEVQKALQLWRREVQHPSDLMKNWV